MPERDVVIIGASAGGIPALRLLLAGLPAGLPASVLVVVHTRAGTDRLPDVLACSPAMPRAALDRVPGAGVWPAAKLGWAIAEQVAAPAPPAIAPQFQPPYVKGH